MIFEWQEIINNSLLQLFFLQQKLKKVEKIGTSKKIFAIVQQKK
jgi:hypothetical protein